jgi:putative transcriptional regulator
MTAMRVSARLVALVLAAILLPATLLRIHAALPTPEPGPEPESLTGQLLIASPSMGDPRFYQTVILMVHHDQTGAFGIAVNRPLEERTVASLLEDLGDKDHTVTETVRIFAGGPVQPEIGFVVHSLDYHRSETIDIDGRVGVTTSREILRDIGKKQGPKKSLVAFGYAGWGPGQLEGELRQHGWFTTSEDDNLVFDEPREQVWDDAIKRRSRDL